MGIACVTSPQYVRHSHNWIQVYIYPLTAGPDYIYISFIFLSASF